jgi:hypothetical protein
VRKPEAVAIEPPPVAAAGDDEIGYADASILDEDI